jgi:ubiquinone/menaquinone biosynthesis C-methylase UbiE
LSGTEARVREYYQDGAAEYDATGWDLLEREHRDEVGALTRAIATLAPASTLDVACGTAYLTRWLHGPVVGLDASEAMLRLASERAPAARLVRGDGLALPFSDSTFDRVIAAHFYGHLLDEDRLRFLEEARRVAPQLVIVESAVQPGYPVELWEDRTLQDGSRHTIWKRHFAPASLLSELGNGRVLFDGQNFVAVLSG